MWSKDEKITDRNQTFEKIIKENHCYINKKRIIYELINNGTYFFLSRPRRFGKSLLIDTISWRDDIYAGAGWHLPSGIVRFKEKMDERVIEVVKIEIGAKVEFDPVPMAINQIICNHNTKGHFISVLYNCFLSSEFVPANKGLKNDDKGYLMWHDSCPKNLVKVHEMYRKYI